MGIDATGIGWDADVGFEISTHYPLPILPMGKFMTHGKKNPWVFVGSPWVPTTKAYADAAALLAAADPLFAQGKEAVLVAHSYGGIPACVATRGNGVKERAAARKPGGFRHIVFMSAFAAPTTGLSLLMMLPGGQLLPWEKIIERDDGGKQVFVHEAARDAFYNDFSAEKAQEYLDALVPQSYEATVQPIDFAVPDVAIPKTYIVCEADNALPPAWQHHAADILGMEKHSVSGGHSAFASVPGEVVDVLIKIIEGN
ncbi:hypothetical protein M426DRAFT_15537 [Hypoxylon sp. CI-4A]|nr:hypothetical protein M426DRAFT_15537 [Hypoxylon sp. CI-4A]